MKPPSHPYTLKPSYIPSFLLIPLLPNALIRDIMVANPQSAKRDSLIQKLDQRIVPMPDTMKAEIMEGINFLSEREIVESELSLQKKHERRTFHDLERCILTDSTNLASIDSLKTLLENDPDLLSKYAIALVCFHQDSMAAVNSVLSAIPVTFPLTQEDWTTHQLFQSYFSVLNQLSLAGQYPDISGTTLIDTLFYIASTDYWLPGAFARNLLISNGLMEYSEPIIFPDTTIPAPYIPIQPHEGTNESAMLPTESFIKVFPNPASNYLIIEFSFRPEVIKSIASIEIVDNAGTIIKTYNSSKQYDQILMRTGAIPPGLYFCNLKAGNRLSAFTKFIISK